MQIDVEQIAAAVLRLPAAERAALAARLLDSLDTDDAGESSLTDAEWEAAWAAECDRREAELDADPSIAVPADEVFARAEARLAAAAARRSVPR